MGEGKHDENVEMWALLERARQRLEKRKSELSLEVRDTDSVTVSLNEKESKEFLDETQDEDESYDDSDEEEEVMDDDDDGDSHDKDQQQTEEEKDEDNISKIDDDDKEESNIDNENEEEKKEEKVVIIGGEKTNGIHDDDDDKDEKDDNTNVDDPTPVKTNKKKSGPGRRSSLGGDDSLKALLALAQKRTEATSKWGLVRKSVIDKVYDVDENDDAKDEKRRRLMLRSRLDSSMSALLSTAEGDEEEDDGLGIDSDDDDDEDEDDDDDEDENEDDENDNKEEVISTDGSRRNSKMEDDIKVVEDSNVGDIVLNDESEISTNSYHNDPSVIESNSENNNNDNNKVTKTKKKKNKKSKAEKEMKNQLKEEIRKYSKEERELLIAMVVAEEAARNGETNFAFKEMDKQELKDELVEAGGMNAIIESLCREAFTISNNNNNNNISQQEGQQEEEEEEKKIQQQQEEEEKRRLQLDQQQMLHQEEQQRAQQEEKQQLKWEMLEQQYHYQQQTETDHREVVIVYEDKYVILTNVALTLKNYYKFSLPKKEKTKKTVEDIPVERRESSNSIGSSAAAAAGAAAPFNPWENSAKSLLDAKKKSESKSAFESFRNNTTKSFRNVAGNPLSSFRNVTKPLNSSLKSVNPFNNNPFYTLQKKNANTTSNNDDDLEDDMENDISIAKIRQKVIPLNTIQRVWIGTQLNLNYFTKAIWGLSFANDIHWAYCKDRRTNDDKHNFVILCHTEQDFRHGFTVQRPEVFSTILAKYIQISGVAMKLPTTAE